MMKCAITKFDNSGSVFPIQSASIQEEARDPSLPMTGLQRKSDARRFMLVDAQKLLDCWYRVRTMVLMRLATVMLNET